MAVNFNSVYASSGLKSTYLCFGLFVSQSELEKLKLQIGGQLSTRYENTQRGIAKMVSENDRLRQELQKEVETSERHRINCGRAVKEKERLEREIEEVTRLLANKLEEGYQTYRS